MFITGCILAAIVIAAFVFVVIFVNKKADTIKKYEKFLIIFIGIMIVLGLAAVILVIAGGVKEL